MIDMICNIVKLLYLSCISKPVSIYQIYNIDSIFGNENYAKHWLYVIQTGNYEFDVISCLAGGISLLLLL